MNGFSQRLQGGALFRTHLVKILVDRFGFGCHGRDLTFSQDGWRAAFVWPIRKCCLPADISRLMR
jgi:hypothetical protein